MSSPVTSSSSGRAANIGTKKDASCPAQPSEDSTSLQKGDLGFGLGLKPGAISSQDFNSSSSGQDASNFFQSSFSESLNLLRNGRAQASPLDGGRHSKRDKGHSNGPSRRLRRSNSVGSTLQKQHSHHSPREQFPSFAGVPLGTSLRQQRELFQYTMTEFKQKKERTGVVPEQQGSARHSYFSDQGSIVRNLKIATGEVAVLQSELEACRSQLDSKYRAIRILQSQVAVLNAEKQKNIDAAHNETRSLQKEVNTLQFELEAKSSTFMFSEQTWAERFDRLSIENTTLMATLHARSDEVRRLHAEKVALIRERDELLAMMDANERLQYDRHWSPKNDAYLHNSVSEQLALLGSCMCRGNKPEPCRCARTAALLKKENSSVKDENHRLKGQLEEAYLVADAFRKAFEEQLSRNSSLGRQLADSSCSGQQDGDKNGMKKKPLLPWRRKVDNKNGHAHQESIDRLLAETMGMQALLNSEYDEVYHDESKSRSIGIQVAQPMPDLIRNMAELLNDRSEALAHQRLVAKMLARRTQNLEATMKKYNGGGKSEMS